MENDIKRPELEKLWTWMCGGTFHPEGFETLLANFEGRYSEVAHYVEERLQAELPKHWRWLVPFIDHAAVGEQWQSQNMLITLEPNYMIADGQPPYPDKNAGIFIFRGKG